MDSHWRRSKPLTPVTQLLEPNRHLLGFNTGRAAEAIAEDDFG